MPMNLGLGLGLSRRAAASGAPAFSPASLFALGEAGGWFRPNDLSTLYQDDRANNATTTVGQSVGAMLDQSQGLALGPELVTNGDFSNGSTGWSLTAAATVSGNSLVINGGGDMAVQNLTLTAGLFHRMLVNCTSYTSGTLFCSTKVGANVEFVTFNSAGLKQGIRVTGTANSNISLGAGAFNGTVDDISLRRLFGNHSNQATAGSRPTLRQEAGSGVYFIESDGADSINWTAPAGTYTVAYVIPDGTVTILTGQSLSGATNIMLATQIVEYVAVNRALTGDETAGLSAYLAGVANP